MRSKHSCSFISQRSVCHGARVQKGECRVLLPNTIDSAMDTKKPAETDLSSSPLLLSDSGRWRWRLPLLLFFALQRVHISYRYSCAVACRCRIAMSYIHIPHSDALWDSEGMTSQSDCLMGTPGPSFHRVGPGRESRPGHSDPVPLSTVLPDARNRTKINLFLLLTPDTFRHPLVAHSRHD